MASISRNPTGTWRARFRPVPGGPQVTQTFARKVDAQRWLDEITAAVVTGQYVDPKAGKSRSAIRRAVAGRPGAPAHVAGACRDDAAPPRLPDPRGPTAVASILPSEIQAWVKRLQHGDPALTRRALAPSTVGVVHGVVSVVFKAAVRDRRIMANPCEGTRLPKVERTQGGAPDDRAGRGSPRRDARALRALVTFAAGTGMRQGEVLGLTVDRLDFLRREVARRPSTRHRRLDAPRFGPPKTTASVRTIPLPQVVVDALAAHLAAFPPGPDGLVFTLDGEPITRQSFGHIWRPGPRTPRPDYRAPGCTRCGTTTRRC